MTVDTAPSHNQSESSSSVPTITNRCVILNSYPDGAPSEANFRIETCSPPVPKVGELLLQNLYLSLDPYMRGRMSEELSYVKPIPVGGVMEGATISRVEVSNRDNYEPGDLVLGYGGWQEYAISDGSGLKRLDAGMTKPSLALGVLGMPGFTAYMGLLEIGKPAKGETVVVAAATGAVGSVVGQVAKIKECRVVGIAGGIEKCRYAIDELGFDDCIDRHGQDFANKLKAACPQGIDIYFESVGGEVFEAVLPLLNPCARIPLCGLIANYNDTENSSGPDRLARTARTFLSKRIKVQGFIIFEDFGDRFDDFAGQMGEWVREGSVKFREDVVEGLENAPKAFIGMLEGENFGKLVVHVSHG